MNINQMADDLKDVPQQKLIQYVQDPNSVVPQFLALAEIQRRKTLERGAGAGMPQSTVAQDIMQQASQQGIQGQPGVMGQPGLQQQQGLPAMQRPQGVAALPSGMGEMSYAGGGIIAFAGDKGSDVKEDDDYPIFNVGDALSGVGRWMGKNWEKNKAIREGTYVPSNIEDESGRGTVTPAQATYSAAAPKYASPDQYVPGSRVDPAVIGHAISGSNAPSKPRIAGVPPSAPDTAKAASKEDMYSKYEQMLRDQQAESKAGREQDKYLRLIEAGLGMMGGTSQYAMTNIGQGATPALKGYAQDVAAARKEDAGTVKELMNLGFKKEEAEREAEKLAMTKDLYKAHGAYYNAAANAAGQRAAGAGAGASTKLQIAQEKNVAALIAKWMNTGEGMGKSPEELRDLAIRSLGYNNPGAGGGAAGPTVIPFSSLK